MPDATTDSTAQVAAWAASGAMALTGRADGAPLGPPADLVPKLRGIVADLRRVVASLGGTLDVDPLALLGERAASSGLTRNGTTSCGGATRLLAGGDGWVAVSLARAEDLELVPAWLELPSIDDPWKVIGETVGTRDGAELVERARLVGLPAALLAAGGGDARAPVLATRVGGASTARRAISEVRVLDLSSLWAGPLCGALLAEAGADVIKVESTTRPDGARAGPEAVFDLLNGRKRSVALDLRSRGGCGRWATSSPPRTWSSRPPARGPSSRWGSTR